MTIPLSHVSFRLTTAVLFLIPLFPSSLMLMLSLDSVSVSYTSPESTHFSSSTRPRPGHHYFSLHSSLLRLPYSQFRLLQSTQNANSSIYLACHSDHIKSLFKLLYRLRTVFHIKCKLLVLIFNDLSNLAPAYLSILTSFYFSLT